jgi:hypothetical protein
MKVRAIVLALVLGSSLVPLAQAKKVVVAKTKVAMAARKNAKRQSKNRAKVVHKSVKAHKPVVRKPVKH